ncbi:hypothetical protein [Tenacibaculum sp.]|uniref:hypothetical protein n=1 Tax=Tenacibaculum sp. TaxID=1906242 RepID=UPI003D0FFF53
MKKIFKISYAVLVCLTLVMSSCSDSDNDPSGIAETNLSGKVYGVSFSAKGGKAFTSGDKISVNITNIEADCTSSIFDYEIAISTYIPAEVGVYNDVNVVFEKEGETPLNFLGANVEVLSIANDEITLKVKANSSADNTVEGLFKVAYCQE